MNKCNKNIILGYSLIGLFNLSFWFAIWLLYYLEFTDYRGVGIIETAAILSSVLTEIPTGAIADLLGKKKTLFLAFLTTGIGEFIMTTAYGLPTMIVSVIIISFGYSLYSGTMEAFMYDTLVESKKEDKYSKIVSVMTTIVLIATAFASITGGLLYGINIRFPFYLVVICKLLGVLIIIFLNEPSVDTETFSFRNFIIQNKKGFSSLFKIEFRRIVLLGLTFGIFYTVCWEVLDDTLIVEYGYKDLNVGILYAVLAIIAVPFSLLYPKIVKNIGLISLIIISSIIFIISLIMSPFIGVVIGTLMLMIRSIFDPIYNNSISEIVNRSVASRDRATTISTFAMLKKLPYMIGAYYIGVTMEMLTARSFTFWFAIVFALLIIPQIIAYYLKRHKLMS